MVKAPKKTHVFQPDITNNVFEKNNPPSKSRQQINQENYQKNKAKIKERQQERYQRQKDQAQLTTKQQSTKYYGAEAIKILMSFKEYTELNQQKHKFWLDFQRTLKECAEDIHGIVDIMRLRELADILIKDYRETAKQEIKKGKSWNSLSEEQQQRLIRYWGYEEARIENNYLDEAEKLEKQSQEYLKEIELAKFHEERGKIKCECYACEEQKEIQKEIKAKWKQELDNYERKSGTSDKEQCPECQKWVKELDEDSGVCKGCKEKYE